MFGVPTSTLSSVTGIASGLFGDFSPFIFLVLGIVLGIFALEVIVRGVQNSRQRAADDAALATALVAGLRLPLSSKAHVASMIGGKAGKKTREAIALHEKYAQTMAGPDRVNTYD